MEVALMGQHLPAPIFTFGTVENTGTINLVVGSQSNQYPVSDGES
jgi:hypothetical protein